MTASGVLKRLKEGNARYVKGQMNRAKQDNSRRLELREGQSPFAIILSCADSRVTPEFIFDCGLGELFVVRVAGNIANSASIASIEYAVAHLGSKLIVVLGHESCGAVGAAMAGGDNGVHLNHLTNHIAPALKEAGEGSDVNTIVKTNAIKNAEALAKDSAIIKEAVEEGEVQICSAYYTLGSGEVEFF